jgi:DNA polymerase-3 subunit epsilon
MELKLQKPIVFFDLETTGVNAIHDRIVEISYIKVFPDGNEESKTLRINPERHIPEQSSAIHGIYDEDVKDCPTFKQVARDIAAIFVNSDIAGFNSNYFDVPMLVEEMLRAGIDFDITKCRLIDVQNIYHKLEQRTLSAAYKFYCGKNLEDAHSAQADTRATYEVLKAQLDKYPDKLNNDVQFLSSFSKMNDNVDFAGRIIYNDKHIPVFNFGKYKGQSVEDVLARDPGYYGWMMQGDFPQNTKQVLTKLRLKAIGK